MPSFKYIASYTALTKNEITSYTQLKTVTDGCIMNRYTSKMLIGQMKSIVPTILVKLSLGI
jgi:hypothetical protein